MAFTATIDRPYIPYPEQLQRQEWIDKRDKIYRRDHYSCKVCGAKDKSIEVHHKQYGDGYAWEVPDSWLVTLCSRHHIREHTKEPEIPEHLLPKNYLHLIEQYQEPVVITSIKNQIRQLREKLKDEISEELCEDILRNIMFLQDELNTLLQ